MAKTYYETLGVNPGAKSSEIKAAYRQLVLKHHPDRSHDPSAPQIFRGITEAFETLGDPVSRRKYDESLANEVRRKREIADRRQREENLRKQRIQSAVEAAKKENPAAEARMETKVKPTVGQISEMQRRLSILFGRQKFSECEMLARQIIQVDPRLALPYAVLGDISRTRGSLDDAARMYSLALQMEPTNPAYLKSYEDILERTQAVELRNRGSRTNPQEKRIFAVLVIAVVTLLACIYTIVSPEKPVLGQLAMVSTWTVGVIVMLFLSGASAGAALSVSNLIDRVGASSIGKLSPTLVYTGIALLSFPLALLIYGIVGAWQKSFSITTTRVMSAVACITLGLSLAAIASPGEIDFFQTLLWGGNIVCLGAVGGWTVADSLHR